MPEKILKTYFGYQKFRPLQKEIIDWVLAGKDGVVLMPTGGGKSLCFQIPAVKMGGLTIVISPLISLMQDQVFALREVGIAADFWNSTRTNSEIVNLKKNILNGDLTLLYLAPERFAVEDFLEFLTQMPTPKLIAIDEAHCISQWGHDFRPEYRRLWSLQKMFRKTPILALTATATEPVLDDICANLALRNPQIFRGSFNRKNLFYDVRPVKNRFSQLVDFLNSRSGQSGIIYVFSRRDAEMLSDKLRRLDFSVAPYHAGLEPDVRAQNQTDFIRDETKIIVATIAFGMGIDKPDVRFVVHFSLPRDLESYYQETGRAGRDGDASECVLFFSRGDKAKIEYFFDDISDDLEREKAEKRLAEMVEFAENTVCRRRRILAYFGEKLESSQEKCCDICARPPESFDATEIAYQIFSTIIRTRERFGANAIAEILRGKISSRNLGRGFESLPVFAIAKNLSKNEILDTIRSLIREGFCAVSDGKYPILAMTGKGNSALRGRQKIQLQRQKIAEKEVVISESEMTDDAQNLFEKMREKRLEMARERGVPPYVIFHDSALRQIAATRPKNRISLQKIHGIGERKADEFGDIFLGIVAEFESHFHLQKTEK